VSSGRVTRLALGLQAAYVGLAFGWRSWLQYRATGDTGFRVTASAPPAARLASALIVGGAAAGWAGTARARTSSSPGSPIGLLGLAGMATALAGTYRAQLDMGRSWRVGVDTAERTDLVTGGMFRYVRNPIFSFMALFATANALAVPNAATATGAVLLVAGVNVQTRLVEEPYLQEAHGQAYSDYVEKTGRFLPRAGA
jgi:protein-S-isoprenylcysteine O-methyltransferase Ste14